MRIRSRSLVLVLGVCVALSLAGCSSSARSALVDDMDVASIPSQIPSQMAPKPIARPSIAVDMLQVEGELPAAPPPQTVYYRQGGRGFDSCCGLPCENGCGSWHVRAVVGWPLFVGDDDAIEGCYYFGADVGRTFPCCLGVDLFYRQFGCEADRTVGAGAGAYTGTDVGTWYTIGVKATMSHSINNGKVYWYAGIGPEFFWAQDFVATDEGFGGFAEVGLGYMITRHLSIRAGLDVHALSTSAARLNTVDDGSTRLLWVFAPIVGVSYDF